MRRLLWVGDAGVPSGFAQATHQTLNVLRETWDVTVLGINYRGDPHEYPYPIYACMPAGDSIGVNRLIWMMDLVNPDVVVFQNDPWHIPLYLNQLAKVPLYNNVPTVGAIAVDGLNCQGAGLNKLDHCIFWTEFGQKEAALGGHTGPSTVVPLGVDLDVFSPGSRHQARLNRKFPPFLLDQFVVGNVNRNQPRKRWDLTVQYFAEWINSFQIRDAWLYLHVAPTGDTGFGVQHLCQYYGILDRLIIMEPPTWYGVSPAELVDTYRSFDVQVSTSQGEGFGLTTFEGMACGIPQIVPQWSALEELTVDAAIQVPCTSTSATPGGPNSIGGVADKEGFINALGYFYDNRDDAREQWADRGILRVNEPRYRWRAVGEAFGAVLDDVVRRER